ncbi:ABC transporter ATP-binding protein [Sagittula sp. S175]|uniref:ABC transporter ATP-binding protein n=1 Tax=Sagittula sp. S175 TaxID=3415129 RepID=UPI003C7A0E9C
MSLPLLATGLTVKSESGRVLLDVPTLTVKAGTLLGIAGPSGAGKTTLLNALSGLLSANGSVRWGEVDLLTLSEDRRDRFRAAHMGLIFQDFLLFDELSARENAELRALFLPKQDRAEVVRRAGEHLTLLGLDDDMRPVASYSGGERQRVAIARALAGNPEIVLADEPTAALDRRTAERLISDLVALARSEHKTLIAVSHDPHLLELMDRVLHLDEGRLVSEDAA